LAWSARKNGEGENNGYQCISLSTTNAKKRQVNQLSGFSSLTLDAAEWVDEAAAEIGVEEDRLGLVNTWSDGESLGVETLLRKSLVWER